MCLSRIVPTSEDLKELLEYSYKVEAEDFLDVYDPEKSEEEQVPHIFLTLLRLDRIVYEHQTSLADVLEELFPE